MRHRFLLVFVAVVSVALASATGVGRQARGTPRPAAPAGPCDRRCLLQFLTEYTEALTDNNTARLAVAPTLRVTNNGA
jgi:hypothetical protein